MKLAVGAEGLTAPGQYLVAVCLMAHIPYDAVLWCVEDIMQGDGELHHAEAGRQMAGVHRQFVDDVVAQFCTKLRECFYLQLAQVSGTLYGVKYLVFAVFHHLCCMLTLYRDTVGGLLGPIDGE